MALEGSSLESGPIFKQLARRLAEPIESGECPVGVLLPTEEEIAKRHGVSRHTVRHALAELRALGLIESRQGVGTTVVRSSSTAVFSEKFSSVQELIQAGRGNPMRALAASHVIADATMAEKLRGRPSQSYLKIDGLRFGKNRKEGAVGFVEVYVDAMYAGIEATLPRLKTTVAEAIFELYGVSIARIEQEMSAVSLEKRMAGPLKVRAGTPALLIERWYHASNGRVFEVASTYYPMGRFVHRSVLTRGISS